MRLSRSSTTMALALCSIAMESLRIRASICLCKEMSRMALLTRSPSSVCSGLRLISTGNSVASFLRQYSSRPTPKLRTPGEAK